MAKGGAVTCRLCNLPNMADGASSGTSRQGGTRPLLDCGEWIQEAAHTHTCCTEAGFWVWALRPCALCRCQLWGGRRSLYQLPVDPDLSHSKRSKQLRSRSALPSKTNFPTSRPVLTRTAPETARQSVVTPIHTSSATILK